MQTDGAKRRKSRRVARARGTCAWELVASVTSFVRGKAERRYLRLLGETASVPCKLPLLVRPV